MHHCHCCAHVLSPRLLLLLSLLHLLLLLLLLHNTMTCVHVLLALLLQSPHERTIIAEQPRCC
jgi:hypothetical protein